MIELIKNQHLMVGETEEDLVPLHTIINNKKMKDSKFVELLDYYISMVARSDEELNIMKTAFNMYSIGYMDTNLRKRMEDSRSIDKYKRAKTMIAQLFNEVESFSPDGAEAHFDIQEKDNLILEYIDQNIDLLLSTQSDWKKIHRNNAEYHLNQNNIKKHRHKEIFSSFKKIMTEYSPSP